MSLKTFTLHFPLFCIYCLVFCFIQGCGAKTQEMQPMPTQETTQKTEIGTANTQSKPYTVAFTIQQATGTLALSQEEHDSLLKGLQEVSQLVARQASIPQSALALERRTRSDIDIATKFMHSQGYYNAYISYTIAFRTEPAQVHITVEPRQCFTVQNSHIDYISPTQTPMPEQGQMLLAKAPKSLVGFGLKEDMPAHAANILDAVAAVTTWLQEHGFPFATMRTTRYEIYPSKHIVTPLLHVDTGPFCYFGNIAVQGAPNVDMSYLQKLMPWQQGTVWRASELPEYVTALQRTGLFSEIIVTPADPKDIHDATLPISVRLREGPDQQLSTGVKYATDDGFGVQGRWLHRNLFGSAETLSFTALLSQEEKSLTANFAKPSFFNKDQQLVLSSSIMDYTSDGYDMQSVGANVGIERTFSRRWWGGIQTSLQSGLLKEEDVWEDFYLLGIPLSIRYNNTDDILNPQNGIRFQTTVAPWFGEYHKNLFALGKAQAELSGYYAPCTLPNGTSSDWLILAARARLGTILSSENIEDIPASLRFYTGGGGSVRGYDFQRIGPTNADGDPQGGLSSLDVNAEVRFKVTDYLGFVPFIDGGMVYENTVPDLVEELRWSAGLGFRYYSPVGPLRLDIAMPINPSDGQRDVFVYMSIGQSF